MKKDMFLKAIQREKTEAELRGVRVCGVCCVA